MINMWLSYVLSWLVMVKLYIGVLSIMMLVFRNCCSMVLLCRVLLLVGFGFGS